MFNTSKKVSKSKAGLSIFNLLGLMPRKYVYNSGLNLLKYPSPATKSLAVVYPLYLFKS